MSDDFYEDDEPIESIQEIRRQPPDFVTAPPDLRIVIHRENGCWWAEIDGHDEYVAGDDKFDGLCERLAEGLHLLGLNRERSSVTITECPSGVEVSVGSNSILERRVFVFREQAS